MSSSLSRKIPMIMGALLLAATLFTAYTAQSAIADHEPAMKAGAAGDDLRATSNDEKPIALLSETMRVSSPEDVIIQVTSECSILTSLLTGDGTNAAGSGDEATDSAFAFGQVKMFVTIDGTRVPVSMNDTETAADEHGTSDTDDLGEVVFCNRAYQRTVTDSEDGQDGLDTQSDFIRTRTANAFNWLAFDTGVNYDSPVNGNNIIHVILWGEFDKSETPCDEAPDDSPADIADTCSEAVVGSRTMIIEPVKVSNHEVIAPHEPTPAPTTTTPPADDKGKP